MFNPTNLAFEKQEKQSFSVLLPDGQYHSLDDSVKYDKRLMINSSSELCNPPVQLIQNLSKTFGLYKDGYKARCKIDGFNNLISNIYRASIENKTLIFPRRSASYSNWSHYGLNYFTYPNMVNIAEMLIEESYVAQWNGYFDKEKGSGKISRVWGTQKFLDAVNIFGYQAITREINSEKKSFQNYFVNPQFSKLRFNNPIILKDTKYNKKRPMKYQMTQKVARMKRFLEEYNSFIGKNKIVLPCSSYDCISSSHSSPTSSVWPTISPAPPLLVMPPGKLNNYINLDCWLHRVFNNRRFDNGGRFYGAEYQSLNKGARKMILINNNPVVEIDYKALHPRMIYHLQGIDYSDDPYTEICNTLQLRKPIKKMMQIMINAESELVAIRAFNKYLQDKPGVKKLLSLNGLSAYCLMNKINQKHSRIATYFNSGMGVYLQFRDSRIAERILKYFTKREIVCLCVHDSFIVDKKYLDELSEVMKSGYKNEMGFECLLEVN